MRSRRRSVAAWVAVVLAVVAAVGWLYLIRSVTALALGPHVPGALPLQQLAGDDDQPLARMVVAWVPAGVAAALALSAGTTLSPRARAATVASIGWIVLVLTGAVSDAAAISASVPSHVPGQLTRAGIWTAVALLLIGALLVRRPAPAQRSGRALSRA